MPLTRTASAVWEGDLAGSGRTTMASGTAGDLPVSWRARAEEPGGATSPEELIAAAHASCYAMALSHELAEAGGTPRRLDAEARVTFGPTADGGFAIQGIALSVRGDVEGVDADAFGRAAEAAKDGCPVSQALRGNVPITLDASLA